MIRVSVKVRLRVITALWRPLTDMCHKTAIFSH